MKNDHEWWGLFVDGYLEKVMKGHTMPSLFDFDVMISTDHEYLVEPVRVVVS